VKALFPYIGESILRVIIDTNPAQFEASFGLPAACSIDVLIQRPLVFPKAKITFDGFQNLDLGLLVNKSKVIPIEIKLGRTGLNKANVDRLLKDCSISTHKSETRIAGNMLAVLNRNLNTKLRKAIGADRLHAKTDYGNIPVTDEWGIIARSSILESWERNKPKFNDNVKYFSLEKICDDYGKQNFNKLTLKMLKSGNYYKDWIEHGV
jgi:hypothetical protein